MRAAAGFHCDSRGRACCQKFDQLWSGILFTINSFAVAILAMNMEEIFTQLDTNERNVFHDGSSTVSLSSV